MQLLLISSNVGCLSSFRNIYVDDLLAYSLIYNISDRRQLDTMIEIEEGVNS